MITALTALVVVGYILGGFICLVTIHLVDIHQRDKDFLLPFTTAWPVILIVWIAYMLIIRFYKLSLWTAKAIKDWKD